MRFDDRLTTLLTRQPKTADAKAALWAQIADSVSQAGTTLSPATLDHALRVLLEWRLDVTPARRRQVSASLASPRAPAEIVALFASDSAEVAAPMLLRATLPEEGWSDLIPRLSAHSRNLLRQRRDLPFAAQRSLRLFAGADQTLPSGPESPAEASQPIQIRDLVARIEAYRKSHGPLLQATAPDRPVSFRFETGPDGVIEWVDGGPPAAVIGLGIGEAAAPGESGVDEALAAAFTRREVCERGRLGIFAQGPCQGRWQVRAAPFCAPDGSFAGMRGVASRLAAESRASADLLRGGLAPESMRQLAHELRTPLNAIRGFADLIAGQYLGPAPQPYRERALSVAIDAQRLAEVIDDLDCAARLDMGAVDGVAGERSDAGNLVRKVANQMRSRIEAGSLTLRITTPVGLPEIAVDAEVAEGLVERLLSLAIEFAEPGEALSLELTANGHVSLALSQPGAIARLAPDDLFESALSTDESNPNRAPLGLGFTLRLIKALAAAHDGGFAIVDGHFQLFLPTAAPPVTQAA